jgi:hypothetical protein
MIFHQEKHVSSKFKNDLVVQVDDACRISFSYIQYQLRRLIENILFRSVIAILFLSDLIVIIISTIRGFMDGRCASQ